MIDSIGNTLLYHLQNTNIFAKLECYNPTGSIKDRIVKEMILAAKQDGSLQSGWTIIEPTSGNTGISLAAIGRELGYEVIIVLPESMTEERKTMIQSFGAKLIQTKSLDGMQGAIRKAQELRKEIPNSLILSQFDNPHNPQAHYRTTALEIWKDMQGQVDIVVAGIGTGGTITGIAQFMKEKNPTIKIIGVEPAKSPVLTRGFAGIHQIQGIGAGFIPKVLDVSLIDEIVSVEDEEAIETTKRFFKEEGIFVGISSGAALVVAKRYAQKYPNARIVVIFPDSGDRYLSFGLLDEV